MDLSIFRWADVAFFCVGCGASLSPSLIHFPAVCVSGSWCLFEIMFPWMQICFDGGGVGLRESPLVSVRLGPRVSFAPSSLVSGLLLGLCGCFCIMRFAIGMAFMAFCVRCAMGVSPHASVVCHACWLAIFRGRMGHVQGCHLFICGGYCQMLIKRNEISVSFLTIWALYFGPCQYRMFMVLFFYSSCRFYRRVVSWAREFIRHRHFLLCYFGATYPSMRPMYGNMLFSLSGVCGSVALGPAVGDAVVGVVHMGVWFGRLSVPVHARFSRFRRDVSLRVLNMIAWRAFRLCLRACVMIPPPPTHHPAPLLTRRGSVSMFSSRCYML